jgi:prepilin-type N-terminal cleavage/methylation domain-containing protein
MEAAKTAAVPARKSSSVVTMNAFNDKIRRGFTLVELLAVLVLLAILAGSAALSLRGPYRAAQLENALESAALADNQVRDYARRCGKPAQIVVRIETGAIAGVTAADGFVDVARFRTHVACLDEVIVGGRRSDCGETAIPVSPRGWTPTYALRFQMSKGGHRWLAFLGVTGQTLRIDDERELETLWRLQPQRPDAD